MESPDHDKRMFERLMELERPLVEAIWRRVLYGETLDDILAQLIAPGVADDTSMGLEVRELVAGTYRHILNLEAKDREASAN